LRALPRAGRGRSRERPASCGARGGIPANLTGSRLRICTWPNANLSLSRTKTLQSAANSGYDQPSWPRMHSTRGSPSPDLSTRWVTAQWCLFTGRAIPARPRWPSWWATGAATAISASTTTSRVPPPRPVQRGSSRIYRLMPPRPAAGRHQAKAARPRSLLVGCPAILGRGSPEKPPLSPSRESALD